MAPPGCWPSPPSSPPSIWAATASTQTVSTGGGGAFLFFEELVLLLVSQIKLVFSDQLAFLPLFIKIKRKCNDLNLATIVK
jgi:hypothetical protein